MNIAISQVKIGERRREDYGDLEGLAESIQKYGLLHPIVLNSNDELVCGERRLRACRDILGWEEIEARDIGDLTEAERREIELEENLRRKDLTSYERNKNLVALVETVRARVLTDSVRTTGRPPTKATEAVAQEVGVPRSTIAEAEQHVETADEYPFMQAWKQYHVLEAREQLDALRENDRPRIAELLSEPGVPVRTAITILRNVRDMKPPERDELFRLYKSGDVRDVELAKTRAVAGPPAPDPRVLDLAAAITALRRSVKQFPDDRLTPRFQEAIASLSVLQQAVRDLHKERTG